MTFHVVLRGIDIYSRCLEIAVKGQRLIDIALHHMQPHILVDATIVAEEILVVPLETAAGFLLRLLAPGVDMLLIAPVIVNIDGEDILTTPFYIWRKVEPKGHNAILAPTEFLAIKEAAGAKANAFKLYE